MSIWSWVLLPLVLYALYSFVTSFRVPIRRRPTAIGTKRTRLKELLFPFLTVALSLSLMGHDSTPRMERILIGCVVGLLLAESLGLFVRSRLSRAREQASTSSHPGERPASAHVR